MVPSENEPDEVAAVVTAWDRIETWLKAHAPMSHATLRPPAASGQLEAAEQETGFALPAGLKALWLLLSLPLPLRLRWLWDMGAGGALYPVPPDPAAFEREPGYAEMLGQDLPEQILWLWEQSGLPLPALLVGDEEAEDELNTFLHREGLLRIERAMSLYSMMVSTGQQPGAWLPFTADNPDDPYAGSFLDTGTGKVGRWGLMDVPSPGEETLSGFLVSAADALG